MASGWEIEFTEEFRTFWAGLTEEQQEGLAAKVQLLANQGPTLKRPAVGKIEGSAIPNLKELVFENLRVLFCFDPRQTAILLVGGDKSQHGFKDWYRPAITQAERLYEVYLQELRDEGLL